MGSLRKARKRADSKSNSAARKKRDSVHSGGRQATTSQNISNKANTARLQGESTFQVRNADGSISTFNTADAAKVQQQVQDNQRVRNEVRSETGHFTDRTNIKDRQADARAKELRDQTKQNQKNLALSQPGTTEIPRAEHSGFRKDEDKEIKEKLKNLKKDNRLVDKIKFDDRTSTPDVKTVSTKSQNEFQKRYGNDKRVIPGKENLFVDSKPTGFRKDKNTEFEKIVKAGHSGFENTNTIKTNEQIKLENQKIREQNREIRQQQKQFVIDAKARGSEFLIISKPDGTKEVIPTDQGFRGFVANPNSTISEVPTLPKDTAPVGLPTSSGQFLISTAKPVEVKEEFDKETDPLNLKGLENYNPYTPDENIQGAKKPTVGERLTFVGTSAAVELGSGFVGMNELFQTDQMFQAPKENRKSFYVPQTAPGDIISAPVAAGLESRSIGQFQNKTGVNFNRAIAEAQTKPIEQNLGQGIGFVGSLWIPGARSAKIVKSLSPIAYTKTPILTSRGTTNLVSTISVGYGSKTKTLVSKSPEGISLGSQKKFGTIENIQGTKGTNSFETFELADYSKQQLKNLKPNIAYAEEKGIIGKGDFGRALEKGETTLEIRKKVDFDYVKEVDPATLEKQFPGIKGKETSKVIAQQQKSSFRDSPNLFLKKGSGIVNELKGSIKTKLGDLDFDAGIKNPKRFQKLQELRSKVEVKINSELGDNIFFHGTSKESAKGILKGGFDFDKSGSQTKGVVKSGKRADDITLGSVFAANNEKLAGRFAKSASKGKSDEAILKVELKQGAKIFKDFTFDPQKQKFESLVEFAKSKGYEGILKPIGTNQASRELVLFSSNPIKKISKTDNLSKLRSKLSGIDKEITYLGTVKGKQAAQEIMKVGTKPGYKFELRKTNIFIKDLKTGKSQEFVNIVTSKEQRVSAVGELGKSGSFFGDKIKKGVLKQDIKGVNNFKILSQDFKQQLIDWGRSTSGIVSQRTLKGYKGDKGNFPKLFSGKTSVRIGQALFHRAEKDFTRQYFFGFREAAKQAHKQGDSALAKRIGMVMNKEYHANKGIIDIPKAIKKLRDEESFEIKRPQGKSQIESIASTFGKYGSSSAKQTNPITVFKDYENKVNVQSKSGKSIVMNPKSIGSSSVKSPSVKSPSVKSPSVKSPSVKSPSVKSSNLESIKSSTSGKSISKSLGTSIKSVGSALSPKSTSTKSPSTRSSKSPSTRSVKSPSTRSVKSPSTKSPSTKIPSLKSPKSPSVRSPFIKPRITKLLTTRVTTVNPPDPGIPLLFGNEPKRRKKFGGRGYSSTVQLTTYNPLAPGFSIKEGKGRSVLKGFRYEF